MVRISAVLCYAMRDALILLRMPILSLSFGRLLREALLYVGASPQSRWHQLETLRNLDDHMLRDIGVCRSAAISGRPQDRPNHAFVLRQISGSSAGI